MFHTEGVTFSGRRISTASHDPTVKLHHRLHDPVIVDVIDAPAQSFDVGRWISLQLRHERSSINDVTVLGGKGGHVFCVDST